MKNADMLLTGGFVAVTVVAVLAVHILQPDPAEGFVCRTPQVADPNWVLSHPTPLEPGRLKQDD